VSSLAELLAPYFEAEARKQDRPPFVAVEIELPDDTIIFESAREAVARLQEAQKEA
jgi:hypothetical protein